MGGRTLGDKARWRIARFLAAGAARPQGGAMAGTLLLDGGPVRATVAVDRGALKAMAAAGLINRGKDGISLSGAGLAWFRRHSVPGDGFQAQHRDMQEIRLEVEGTVALVAVNLAESPLAALARRKAKDGRPFLEPQEWQAGERLRADYTKGRIMPRLGANWEASVAAGRRDGGNGVADITQAALAARQRVDRALDAVGPELAGVLVDICCFLKGLEQVELERGWPVRSAKIVLKSALGALARHYQPERQPRRRGATAILHWGSEDYRPRIG